MLTRYRELYNKLTHSTAFVKDKGLDNTKINKKIFTPHNLKSLLIGANGAVGVYYTTNSSTSRLVEWYPFSQGYTSEKEYVEYMKEKKGMVDALTTGLKFNYIEEIIFFNGGFPTEQELYKEQETLNRFAQSEAKSFKRLRHIAIVNSVINEDVLKINPQKSIAKQLRDLSLPIVPLVEYHPERNELGLLPNPGLDSTEYTMDGRYEESLPVSEKGKVEYRLSKYFYDERKRAEAAIKAKEEEKKQEEYDLLLLKAVDATIEKLDSFYAPLWNGRYSGIIHKDGVAFSKSDTVNKIKSLTQAIYKAWSSVALNGKDSCEVTNSTIQYGRGYIPGFHMESLKSKESWDKNKNSLRSELLRKYNEYFEKEPQKINELDKGITNCLVIKSRGRNQLILQMTGVTENQLNEFKKSFDETVGKVYLGSAMKGLIADAKITNGILSLTYIIDYNAFLKEVLFAYKAYNNGFKPSLSAALVGLKMNGTPLTVNLIDPRKILTTIIAGSRSGKGTMTMGLLASIFGAGGSVVYLDNKPDIGAMLWDLEREYANQGLKLLSVDIGKECQEFSGATPIRTGSLNLIDEDRSESDLFRTLRLAKMFQLISFIGYNASKIKNELGVNPQNLFFIADELTSTNIDYTKLSLYVEKKCKDYEGKANKAKATEREKELATYYKKLNNILDKTPDNLTKGLTKDFGQSGVKIIVIGQQMNSGWKVAGANFVKSFAGKMITNSHISFAGRLQATDKTFKFSKEQADLADKSGVFEYSYGRPAPLDDVLDYKEGITSSFVQFRSYFSLVKNDFDYNEYMEEGTDGYITNHGNRYTTQFLSNYVSDESTLQSVIKELYDFDNSCPRNEVSFGGLLKVMQSKIGMNDATLVSNMNKGYTLVDAVFRKMNLGNYSCVEEYLCDCSPESLFTQEELADRFDGIIHAESKSIDTDNEVFELYKNTGVADEKNKSYDSTISQKSTSQGTDETNQPHIPVRHPNGQPTQAQGYQSPTQAQNAARPTRTSGRGKAYTGKLEVENNPFELYSSESNSGTILSVKEMTKIIMADIEKRIGDNHLITDFRITESGVLVFNNVAYQPYFDESFLSTLPLALRNQVESGELVELFNLRKIYNFTNLTSFVIENESLAQGRARKELGIGFRKRYSVLFKKLGYLNYIQVGHIKYNRENPDSNVEKNILDAFKTNPSSTYTAKTSNSRMDRVWDSKPVRVLTNAFGWTMGAKAVLVAATLFGPIGLLFGAFAMAGAYNELKPKQTKPTQGTQAKRRNTKQWYNQGYDSQGPHQGYDPHQGQGWSQGWNQGYGPQGPYQGYGSQQGQGKKRR